MINKIINKIIAKIRGEANYSILIKNGFKITKEDKIIVDKSKVTMFGKENLKKFPPKFLCTT